MKEAKELIYKIRELLWKLSGGDYIIIQACDKSIQNKFAFVGLFVCVNFLLCLLSGAYTTYHFFGNMLLSIPISGFFAWMVINIYLVLLTTLSKNKLPHAKDVKALGVSTAIRVAFVLFMAIIISKPIESFFFENHPFIISKLQQHRETLIHDILQGNERITAFDRIVVTEKIADNYFFSYRLRQINYLPESWLVTLIIIGLFFLPAIIKYLLPGTNGYYNRKGILEKNLILKEYSEFLISYRESFARAIGRPVEYKPVCIVTETQGKTDSGIFKFFPERKLKFAILQKILLSILNRLFQIGSSRSKSISSA
jgi:hypothetical protein